MSQKGVLMSKQSDLTAKSSQFVALDTIRALAAIVVFLGHVRIVSFVSWENLATEYKTLGATLFYAVARLGQDAVLVFFVLSGFFVGGQMIARMKQGQFRISDYATDRATRLLLPLVPACVLTLAVSYLAMGNLDEASNVMASLLGLNGVFVETSNFNLPLWSIAFEIWFYVAAGAFASAWSGAGRPVAFLVMLASAYVFSILNIAFLLFWVIGAAIFLARAHLRKPLFFVVGIAIAGIAAILFELHDAGPDIMLRDKAIHLQALICIGFAIAIPYLTSETLNDKLQPFAKASAFLAASSYSLYVFHYPVLMLISLYVPKVETFGPMALVYFGLISLAVFSICLGLWFLFERQTDTVRRMIKGMRRNHGRSMSAKPV
tara:strand:- start:80091 stop:81221 length:1131 start_codon:yes stop_codon:yes gene_type:complete